ncbi:WhiB family transcriptional regulator [Streptomyces sp. NPDC048106]|uniref:WhiB family transcriptional regulator n=1 Tax=Streptomyces sp. NPDC048106 TaxID=3155750 RepID=UPI003451AC2A
MRAKKRIRPLADVWEWQMEAACRGLDGAVFYSPAGERGIERARREERARSVCQACPVREKCALFALALGEPYGVWGGLTEAERRHIARQGQAGRAPSRGR